MNIVMIGTGYVGLVSGACFSQFGFTVVCVDRNAEKIDTLNQGGIPIYEPGLDDLVARNRAAGRLSFTTELGPAVAAADAVFIAVGTPARRGDGHADLTYVHAAAAEIATHLTGYTVVVTKSTVPVGTGRQVQDIIAKTNPDADFDVASNPEFLREGSAISDFMRPDRVIVGCLGERAHDVMRSLYRPLYLIETPVQFTDLETAELIKYASNAFLALKISYINQMADLCEKVGADIHTVAKGIGLDGRIGPKFLHPGPGYGGSCFPKDTLALVRIANSHGVDLSILSEAASYNTKRKLAMAGRIKQAMQGVIAGQKIAILGLAFKPETDDVRDSPALDIIPELLSGGAEIHVYDPAAMAQAKQVLPKAVQYHDDAASCLSGADAAVIVTEWNEFRALTPASYVEALAQPVLIDLRNVYNPEEMRSAGLRYSSVGRL